MTWIVRLGEFIKLYGGSDLPSQLFTKVAKRRVWWCFAGLIDKCVASSQDLFLSNFLDTNWTSVQTELPASAFTSRPILAVVLIRRSRREGITLINELAAGSDMTDSGWDVAVKIENIDSENKNQSRKPKRGTMLFWVSGFSPPPLTRCVLWNLPYMKAHSFAEDPGAVQAGHRGVSCRPISWCSGISLKADQRGFSPSWSPVSRTGGLLRLRWRSKRQAEPSVLSVR